MILYITEKTSQVSALRNALKKNNMLNNVEIVPLAGHIMSLYDFKDYDKSLDDYWVNLVVDKKVPFFPKELKKKIKPKSSFIIKGKKTTSDYKKKFTDIKTKILQADKIILAPDPDNEGATLALEVIDECEALHKVTGMINMSKLDILSLTKEVKITNKIPYLNMYACGDSRAYFDQTFGINMSIVATVVLGGGKTLQIGGVKLPTIRMVVERDLAFEQHKEIPFWSIKAKAQYGNDIFDIEIYLKSMDKEARFDKESDAVEVKRRVKQILKGNILTYKELNKKTPPPKPYSLTDLQSEANKRFKLSADATLKIAQKLYADYKMQSYPRTDSNYYSEGEYIAVSDILNNLNTISNFKPLIKAIKNISKPLKRKIFDDEKIDAHTALAPTQEATNSIYFKLSNNDKEVFNLVATRYIIQFLNDYEYLDINGTGAIDDTILFKFSENIPKKLGWKISTDFSINQRTIPTMQHNDIISIHNDSISITKGTTKPKPRFTEATLLKAMAKVHRFFDDENIKKELGENGIGTPATRAIILEQLKTAKGKDEAYFKIDKKGIITSTSKARNLINVLPDKISSPILRANMEAKLKQILHGKLSKENYFLSVKNIVEEINNTILKLGTIPNKKINSEINTIDLICPLCGNKMVDNNIVYKCSKQKYSDGKVNGCKFSLFKKSKPLGRDLTLDDVKSLLNGGLLIGKSGNVKLDLENKYFTTVEWHKYNSTSYSNSYSEELQESKKTYTKNGKLIWKNFRGKDLSKSECEQLLDGKNIKLKRKSQAGKTYEIIISLIDDNGKIKADFV